MAGWPESAGTTAGEHAAEIIGNYELRAGALRFKRSVQTALAMQNDCDRGIRPRRLMRTPYVGRMSLCGNDPTIAQQPRFLQDRMRD
jgi:hypothetical protein